MSILWGIDLGGTKVEGVVLEEGYPPRTLARLRVPTEKEKGYRHIVGQIGLLVEALKKETGLRPEKVGIGTPGALDPSSQTMKNSNTTVLNGQFFKRDIEEHLDLPIAMANDANCFAVAEAMFGAVRSHAPEARVVFGVIMGTGVGGGVVVDGRVLGGRHGIAGEWGHNFLDISGGPCYCGLEGCVETIFSGPALERFYHGLTGQKRSLREIATRAEKGGDDAAEQTLQRLVHFFGKGIACIVNILDPDVVVLGCGVGNIERLYRDGPAECERYVFNHSLQTMFLKPELGDSAGVFGAALLVKDL